MDEPQPAAGASELSDLAAAAREHLLTTPSGRASVPANPGVRLAAAACDVVLAFLFSLSMSCMGFLWLGVILGVDPEGPLGDPLFFSLVAFGAVVYTSPEAFGWPTFAKSWFRLRIAALHPDARRCYRRRWLLKAMPVLVLFVMCLLRAIDAAVVVSGEGRPGQGGWVWPSITISAVALPVGFVAVGFLACFGAGRQAVYDRVAATLVVRTTPKHRLHDRGFDVLPMGAAAGAPLPPVGLAGPAGGGYPPAADHE
jgi:hypothetical protein